ncbi:hypothetical protein MNB_SV-15-984 [hydrothermal vent metagenome]|uniref:Uncharacterized protein n=1 Tax=hydrothermal vent metagenome TaxID=652676 RepID=A0A1W1EIN0_9ZZZZ
MIDEMKDFSKENVQKALNSLRNPQRLKQIVATLKKESPAKYQSFRKAVSFDPQIAIMLDSLESKASGVP